MVDNNELMHYGVVGMRWGVHRARRKGKAYKYKSSATKKQEARAMADPKNKALQKKAKRYAEVDAAYQKKALGQSRGKSAAKMLLMGPFGQKTYDIGRATGHSRLESYGAMVVTGMLVGPFGHMASRYWFRNDNRRG